MFTRHALLVLADFVRDRLHLVLHGVQLFVGLHRHDLLFVFLDALLRGGQVLVDGAALGLIVGEGLLGGGEGGRGGLQAARRAPQSARARRRSPCSRSPPGFRCPAAGLVVLDPRASPALSNCQP
jgi:hypothetical protein